MVYSSLPTDDPQDGFSTPAHCGHRAGPSLTVPAPRADNFNPLRFEIFRDFVERVVVPNTPDGFGPTYGGLQGAPWEAIRSAVADSNSIEQALGRAIVFADRLQSEPIADVIDTTSETTEHSNEAFFAFSVADALPDFGDQSRYRSKVTRKVAGVFRPRRLVATVTASFAAVAIASLTAVGHAGG
jgi:hypothetical protein